MAYSVGPLWGRTIHPTMKNPTYRLLPDRFDLRLLQISPMISRDPAPIYPESCHDFLIQNIRPDLVENLDRESALRALDLP